MKKYNFIIVHLLILIVFFFWRFPRYARDLALRGFRFFIWAEMESAPTKKPPSAPLQSITHLEKDMLLLISTSPSAQSCPPLILFKLQSTSSRVARFRFSGIPSGL